MLYGRAAYLKSSAPCSSCMYDRFGAKFSKEVINSSILCIRIERKRQTRQAKWVNLYWIIIIIMNHFYKAHITIYISSLCALGRKRTEKRTVWSTKLNHSIIQHKIVSFKGSFKLINSFWCFYLGMRPSTGKVFMEQSPYWSVDLYVDGNKWM